MMYSGDEDFDDDVFEGEFIISGGPDFLEGGESDEDYEEDNDPGRDGETRG